MKNRWIVESISNAFKTCKKSIKKTKIWIYIRGKKESLLYYIWYTVKMKGEFHFEGKCTWAITTKEAAELYDNDIEYYSLERNRKGMVYIPPYFPMKNGKEHVYSIPDRYYAIIRNCQIIGECSGVVKEGYFIYDIACEKDVRRYELCHHDFIRHKKRKFYIKGRKAVNYEKGILLCTTAGFNYFHFLYGAMTKLAAIDEVLGYEDYPIIVDEGSYNNSNMRCILELLNKNSRKIIVVEKAQLCSVQHLIVLSDNLYLPINVRGRMNAKDFLYDWGTVLTLRDRCLNRIDLKTYGRKKMIFLSRKKTSNSRLINSEEVEKIFLRYGFEVVYPEEMSFEEQVKMFYNADFIAGATGAAMSNLLFCQPDTKYICIVPKKSYFYSFSTIAAHLKLKTLFVDARIAEKTRYIATWKYRCDVRECEEAICLLMTNNIG